MYWFVHNDCYETNSKHLSGLYLMRSRLSLHERTCTIQISTLRLMIYISTSEVFSVFFEAPRRTLQHELAIESTTTSTCLVVTTTSACLVVTIVSTYLVVTTTSACLVVTSILACLVVTTTTRNCDFCHWETYDNAVLMTVGWVEDNYSNPRRAWCYLLVIFCRSRKTLTNERPQRPSVSTTSHPLCFRGKLKVIWWSYVQGGVGLLFPYPTLLWV